MAGLDAVLGSSSATTTTTTTVEPPTRIKRTMAGLDALLGIQEDDKAAGGGPMQASASTSSPARTPAGSDLDKAVESEAQRLSRTLGAKKASDAPKTQDVEDHIQKIIDKARKLANEQSVKGTNASSEAEQAALKREFESFLDTLTKAPETLSKDDIKKLKDAAFGPLTFWVVETRPIQEADRTGLLIRGNLRDDRDKVFGIVCEKVKELFQGRYEVLMVEDTEGDEEGSAMAGMGVPSTSVGTARGVREGPRVAFQIIPAEQARPPQTDALQSVASVILGLLLVVTCSELALSTNISKLPAETIAYFANPANLNNDQIPPGLENWDPSSYVASSVPIVGALLCVHAAHEAGHRAAALLKGVKLGPSFFIPFGEIGSLGAITPFTSLLKNRLALWDVAVAGPMAGAAVASALLLFGLAQSVGADPADPAAKDALIALPTQFFQGSVALGGLTRLVLGEQALRGASVLVSPFVVAGWCGLITTALNLLPVGSLDGGRMVQGSYGQQALALTSFFSYLGLGLGLLGSNLALPFGLYVIICQRTAEKHIQDNVTPGGSARRAATAASVLAAVLVLLPMAPELAEAFGVGPSSPFL